MAKWQDKMSISDQSITSLVSFKRTGPVQGILALAVLIFAAGMFGTANAGPRPGAYDGTWNVVFTTKAGNCSSNNGAPFNVSGTEVSSAGGGKVTGGISPGGAVSVRISLGLSEATGTGRLAGNTGTGRWSGVISGDRCSGTWLATRS